MQYESIRRREFSRRLLPAINEVQLAQRFAPAVEPNIETMLIWRAWLIRGRYDQPIRLHTAVYLGNITTNNQPGFSSPGSQAAAQAAGTALAFFEQIPGDSQL